MATPDLASLYQLHLVDQDLLRMKLRAKTLDGGHALEQKALRYQQENQAELSEIEQLRSSQKEHEDKVAAYQLKIKQINDFLFSGKAVNPKEIAGYEQEVVQLKGMIDKAEERLLEIMEALPQAELTAKHHLDHLANLDAERKKKKSSDIKEAKQLQIDYKAKQDERPKLVKRVSAALLNQYESLRAKHGGIGMAVLNEGKCGACGTQIPEKVRNVVAQDQLATCESCHRILFQVIPEV